jgi:uncharacterized membrane protein YfcA
MLEIAGYLSAVVIGVTLGLIGAGGSILTVPVLVYLFAIEPVTATAYSLFVVGLTALIGSATYMRRSMVSYKTAVLFSIPSIAGVFIARAWIIPAIPDHLGSIGGFVVTKNLAIMILFAGLMVLSSFSMIRNTTEDDPAEHHLNIRLIMIEGFVVGVLTGLVGAGGGFLIIPALVVVGGLPMKTAVGTSLLIIAVKSLLGFTGDLTHGAHDWSFLLVFTLFTSGGILLGTYASRFVSGARLKPAFGWFVLVMGIYVFVRELWAGRL